MKVYLIFECYRYSEEDHDDDVVRVYRSKDDADKYCIFLNNSKKDDSYLYFVVPYEVF